ncbi:hypothetical protein GJ744_005387 [Endocarpon pusillum]|uniref:Uncharacterized protein n=1 Tax=Endocarpon pusillum TaxID=364733 RepID=A0A8H7AQ63_9EURO|nr:hypothetical protein GJ744_005387 [Endocarpon pusillum]
MHSIVKAPQGVRLPQAVYAYSHTTELPNPFNSGNISVLAPMPKPANRTQVLYWRRWSRAVTILAPALVATRCRLKVSPSVPQTVPSNDVQILWIWFV